MQEAQTTGFNQFIQRWKGRIKHWLKPDPSDGAVMKIVKMVLKSLVLLLLIVASPVILVVLAFVFFAAF